MGLYRAILEKQSSQDRAILSVQEQHHLVKVRRAAVGDHFLGYLEGRGWFLCRLLREAGGWQAELIEEQPTEAESPLRIILLQALIKKDRFDWVVQKAVELGVSEIVPIHTARSELKLGKNPLKRVERWRRIIIESMKQCGRDAIPILHEPIELASAARSFQAPLRLFLDEAGAAGLKQLLEAQDPVDHCALFVGPEGGWGDPDRAVFEQETIPGVRFGPRILRAETAPVAVISALQYHLGDLGS